MKIAGFNFLKIKSERKKPKKGQIKVETNLDIFNIEKETLEIGKQEIPFRVEFEYSIKYTPNVADVELGGQVLILTDKKEAKEIQKDWKKKQIPDSMKMNLLNYILAKCNIKAFQLEDELNLPTHVPLPKLRNQQQKSTYTG